MIDIQAIFYVLLSVATTLVTTAFVIAFLSLNLLRYSYFGSIYIGMYLQRKYIQWMDDPTNPKLGPEWYNEVEEGFDSPYVNDEDDDD